MKNYIKLIVILLFMCCASFAKVYNYPFIDVDETIQLYEGMEKEEVLTIIGDPLYVKSGDLGIISWIYEVRTIENKSTYIAGEKIGPTKNSNYYRYSEPVHNIELLFVDNSLDSWKIIEIESNTGNSINKLKYTPNSKNLITNMVGLMILLGLLTSL